MVTSFIPIKRKPQQMRMNVEQLHKHCLVDHHATEERVKGMDYETMKKWHADLHKLNVVEPGVINLPDRNTIMGSENKHKQSDISTLTPDQRQKLGL